MVRRAVRHGRPSQKTNKGPQNNNGAVQKKQSTGLSSSLQLLVYFVLGFGVTHFIQKLKVDDLGRFAVGIMGVTAGDSDSSSGMTKYDSDSSRMTAAILTGGRQLMQPQASVQQQPGQQQQQARQPTGTVAYVISITNCVPKFRQTLLDAASVLRRSIIINSYPVHPTANYQADFIALVPPGFQHTCGSILEQAGFTIMLQDFPVTPEDISDHGGDASNYILKANIHRNGCCGHAELLKLHAFSMVNHTLAVHLDLDTLLLQPLDELLDAMHYDPASPQGQQARRHLVDAGLVAPTYPYADNLVQEGSSHSRSTIDAFYTKDYNMIKQQHESRIGVQGGFFVVRPNITRRDELIDMVKQGDFRPGRSVTESGWFGSGYGLHIWGSMTIQGLFAYYFEQVMNANANNNNQQYAVELHRCRFNQIAENPRRSSFDRQGKFARPSPANASTADWHDTTCRDGRANCDDVQCQTWPISDTRVAHYTYCKVPWKCAGVDDPSFFLNTPLCGEMIHKWFDVRSQVQGIEVADGTFQPEIYNGFCRAQEDYIFIHKNGTR